MRQLLRASSLLWVLLPAMAAASPLSIYGFNPRAIAMGGAQVADADDASATFYNPALLTRRTRVTFGFGLQYVRPNLRVSEVGTTFPEDRRPLLPDDFAQWTLGVLFPLGGKVKNRVALGVGLTIPHGFVVRIHTADPATPFFYLYQSSAQKIVILPAAAVRLGEWVSVGAGLQVLANFGGDTTVEVDLFGRQVERREMLISLTTREAFTAGVSAGPFSGLTVGLSYRQEIGLDYVVPANIILAGVGSLDLSLRGTALWSPHEFAFGAAWIIPGAGTTVSADLTYGLWSRAPAPEVMVLLDAGGPILDGLGLGDALDLCSDRVEVDSQGNEACVPVSPGFVDNLTARLGAEHRLNETVTFRAGYAYRPTPVPNQVGPTNYLDASAHALSVGLGLTFRDPLDVFEQPVTVDLASSAMLLAGRDVDKGSDGTVEYRFGGSLFQFSGAVRYQF